VPRLYEPLYIKPKPLVPRHLIFEVNERIDGRGQVVIPLNMEDVKRVIALIRKAGVNAVAVTFLHSYANSEHERMVGEILRRELPHCFVTLSVEILAEIREYERTSTTVINAYLGPPVKTYLESLMNAFKEIGMNGQLLVMQSSGGMLDAETAKEKPAQIVECGPAAGVIGAVHLGRQIGCDNLITLDMGGTTAKASQIDDGRLTRTDEYEVGGGISLSSRLVKGGGYALKIPVIDISEVGAGGGSIVWFDRVGQIKVGPQSAGANPGPVCYAIGGEEPTVTDANVVLGYLNPKAIAGGTVPINATKAKAAIEEKIAKSLGRNLLEVAYGIHTIANASMIRAVKAVSTYRGRDPRDFVLLAFGGSGGVHAVEIARALEMRRVVVPLAAGVFSALGLLFAEIELSVSCGFLHTVSQSETLLKELVARYEALEQDVLSQLGYTQNSITFRHYADLRYSGQAFELTVPVPPPPLSTTAIDGLAEAFENEHELTYGHRYPGKKAVQVVSLRVTGSAGSKEYSVVDAGATLSRLESEKISTSQRLAYFGPRFGKIKTPILSRAMLTNIPREGPLVIEEYDGTVVVPPAARASLDQWGNISIDLDTISKSGR
jgi:N-methylhydantoinase A